MKKPIKIDDLGVPLFLEIPISLFGPDKSQCHYFPCTTPSHSAFASVVPWNLKISIRHFIHTKGGGFLGFLWDVLPKRKCSKNFSWNVIRFKYLPLKMNECHLKRDTFKRKIVFQPAFFRGLGYVRYVSFKKCISWILREPWRFIIDCNPWIYINLSLIDVLKIPMNWSVTIPTVLMGCIRNNWPWKPIQYLSMFFGTVGWCTKMSTKNTMNVYTAKNKMETTKGVSFRTGACSGSNCSFKGSTLW